MAHNKWIEVVEEAKIPTREEREEPQHEEDCCCGTCETRPFLAKIAALEQRLEQLQRTVEFNEREYLSAHGGSWGVCKYQALNQALEQRLAAAEQAHRVCRAHLEKAESRRDTVETQLLAKTLDTDRIDWLETLIAPSISQYESSWQIHNCGHRTVAVFLRQCIDAARKEGKS